MLYAGLDIHKRYCTTAVMDKEGKVLERARIDIRPEELRKYFGRFSEPMQVAMEACYNWGYFMDVLQGEVEEIHLAHPLKVRLIAEARIKTDAIDAKVLADLLRTNLLPLAYAPGPETRRIKNYLRFRTGLVAMSVQVKNKIHATLDQHDFPEKESLSHLSDMFGRQGLKLLEQVVLPGEDTVILQSWLRLLNYLHVEILKANNWVRQHVQEDPTSQLLKTIPGIGYQFALLIRHEIDDIRRFRNSKKLSGYAGLAPSTYSSGGRTRHGRITKQGNKWLRFAFVEAAQKATITSVTLNTYYQRIKVRAGPHPARVATARKIAEIVFGVLKTNTPYRENIVEQSPSQGSRRIAA